jgi:hypothetical protein
MEISHVDGAALYLDPPIGGEFVRPRWDKVSQVGGKLHWS